MKHKTLKKLAFFSALILLTSALSGCSGEEVPRLSISSEDVSEDYSMVDVDYGDVVLAASTRRSTRKISRSTSKRESSPTST